MQLLIALVTVVAGIGLTVFIFWGMHALVARMPSHRQMRVMPYVFLGPVLVLVTAFLVYPTVLTVALSLTRREDGVDVWTGLSNYAELFGSSDFREVLQNNLLWLIIVPTVTVALGLVVAVMGDRVGGWGEKALKSLIFMPMAISFTAAAAIWRFIYDYQPPGVPQVGALNAMWVGASGGDPVPWMSISTGSLNDLLIMVPVIWLNTGFAMVLISAAIKGVPEDTVEAARMDGASRAQVFFLVVLPQVRGTLLAVFVTVTITVMKIFDIVYAMTNGAYGTAVLGQEFFSQYFRFFNPGRASAVVVILLLALAPIMVYQVRVVRRQEEQ